jgi:hypothetical protein
MIKWSTDTPVNPQQCMQDLLNFTSPFYDFYSVVAPSGCPECGALPGGGGYLLPGFATVKQRNVTTSNGVDTVNYLSAAGAGVTAVTIAPDGSLKDYWSGVDTNFTLRARGGLRITGGTSTGRRVANTCGLLLDNADLSGVELREGRERRCDAVRPFQTNVRGTASYTIPWIDVLASSTFSYRPGVSINANYTVALSDVIWAPGSGFQTEGVDANGNPLPRANAFSGNLTGTVAPSLLSNDTFGEGIRVVDLRLAKNIRFAGKRVNIGADVFNVFNSDAALGYCATFPNPDRNIAGCGSAAANTLQPWMSVTNITTPRYARFQVQFDF